ncbi:MAG: ZIP family metal transporter [Alphaproteobacteria bacterium]|nr:ZIP family metal transporter [Alphaproteobacteria bacterium]
MSDVFSNINFVHGFLGALIAGLFTGVGGFSIFLKRKYTQTNINVLLNLAAGVMLSASFFALLVPAMSQLITFYSDIHVAGFAYCGAVAVGVALVWILNAVLPHEHNNMVRHGAKFDLKKAWLFIIAISLHKFPEGLAVGVAYSAEEFINPMSLLIGIALHNIPEGLTIAISLVAAGVSKFKSACTSIAIGMIQPLGALIGLLFIGVSQSLIPLAMAMAGGTLLFVVINEILPETYGYKETDKSAFAVFTGFIVMSYLFMVLGE